MEAIRKRYSGSIYEVEILEEISPSSYVASLHAYTKWVKELEAKGCCLLSYQDIQKGKGL